MNEIIYTKRKYIGIRLRWCRFCVKKRYNTILNDILLLSLHTVNNLFMFYKLIY